MGAALEVAALVSAVEGEARLPTTLLCKGPMCIQPVAMCPIHTSVKWVFIRMLSSLNIPIQRTNASACRVK